MEIERFMNQGMELNALYQQDIDLGVNWPLFEPVKRPKDIDLPQKFDFQSQNFIVDGETGEFLPIPQNNAREIVTNRNETTGTEFNIDEFLESSIVSEPQNIQLVQSDNTDTINKELWDDIATLSEAYLALDSGECAKQEMSASPMTENVPFQSNQYQSDVFSSPPQIQMQEQKAHPKDHFGNMPYHTFPTPPYNEQSDSPNGYTHHHPSMAFSPEPNKPFSPADLEGAKLAEMMMTQQQNDLLAQLDSVTNINVGNPNPPPVLNEEDITAPGGWFLDGDEPTSNLSEVLAELDIMNNMQNQTGPYMNPSTSPYVPPPIATMEGVNQGGLSLVSEPDSLDSGFGDGMMDIDVHDISHEPTALMSNEQSQESIRRQKLRESRDEKKARELNISLTLEQIINSPVEEYNELLNRANLNPEQQSLVRDIRRRGKNKVAAQNCRKRKIETISSMEMDIDDLNSEREELLTKQKELEDTKKGIQAKYNQLYQQIFNSLRDESGRPYDRSRYSLQQVEGAIILVPGIFGAANTDKPESKSSVAFFDLSKVKIEKHI